MLFWPSLGINLFSRVGCVAYFTAKQFQSLSRSKSLGDSNYTNQLRVWAAPLALSQLNELSDQGVARQLPSPWQPLIAGWYAADWDVLITPLRLCSFTTFQTLHTPSPSSSHRCSESGIGFSPRSIQTPVSSEVVCCDRCFLLFCLLPPGSVL